MPNGEHFRETNDENEHSTESGVAESSILAPVTVSFYGSTIALGEVLRETVPTDTILRCAPVRRLLRGAAQTMHSPYDVRSRVSRHERAHARKRAGHPENAHLPVAGRTKGELSRESSNADYYGTSAPRTIESFSLISI